MYKYTLNIDNFFRLWNGWITWGAVLYLMYIYLHFKAH